MEGRANVPSYVDALPAVRDIADHINHTNEKHHFMFAMNNAVYVGMAVKMIESVGRVSVHDVRQVKYSLSTSAVR